jgi:hypothetical protein
MQLLQMGTTFAQETCPSPYPFGSISVSLTLGDPAKFTDVKNFIPPGQVYGSTKGAGNQLEWNSYTNIPRATRETRIQQIRGAAQAKQREAVLEEQRQAEQRKQSEIAARSSGFVKANGVAHFVTAEQLAANPFVYQGQVVAIYGAFEQMISATQGLFSSQDKRFVVSGIPTARFTQTGSIVMLAGRVVGNIEIKVPILGPTLVPHLSFVGSAFCQQQGCSEYAINLR